MGKMVAVAGVEQRAGGNRAGEVARPAAARRISHVDRQDAPRVVKADVVVDEKLVTLAGDDEVVVAVGADLGGAASLLGDQGGNHGKEVALGLLAAEGAARSEEHPSALQSLMRISTAVVCLTK